MLSKEVYKDVLQNFYLLRLQLQPDAVLDSVIAYNKIW